MFNLTLIDFINFELDFNGKIDGKGSHHAPLYENFPNNPLPDRQNINETVHLIKQNYPISKFVLGICFHGRGWYIPSNLTDTRPPVTLINNFGMRLISYSYICHAIRTKGWQVFYEDVHRNISSYAVAPINDRERWWVSFEDSATVIAKSNYILENGLGGVFLRDNYYDDSDNTCGKGNYPLLTAILKTLNQSIVIRDENAALRCNMSFSLGLLIVFSVMSSL